MQKENDEHSLIDFLKSIYQYCKPDTYLNLRFLPSAENRFLPLTKINTIPFIINSHRSQNCYFAPATRRDGDGSKEGIEEIPALWCDVDVVKGSPAYDQFKQVYKDFPLKPSILVESGGGYHLYWPLKEPAPKDDIPRVEDLLKRIAIHLGGDKVAAEAARILRVPGTYNLKYTPKRKVTIGHFHPEKQYILDDFDFLPPLPAEERAGSKDQLHPPGWQEDLLKGVSDGERNISITKLAGRYIGKGLSKEEVFPILMDANSRFNPPLETKEIQACLDSVFKTHKRNHPEDDPDATEKTSGHHFNLIWAKDVVNTQEPEREWIWQGILISGGSSLIVAKPKIGKTTLATQLAVAVSRGDIFLGRKTRQATVVYLALEEHRDEVQKNLSKLGVTDEPLFIHFGPAPIQAMQEVEPLIRETGAKLLVIDILQKFCRVKDLNDYSQVTRTLEPLMAAGRNLDCQISLTHHAGKKDREDGDDILGSTGLLGGVDTSIHIKKRNTDSRVFSTIQRYGTDIPPTVIALKDGCLVMEGSREEVEIHETMPLILEALGGGPLTEKEVGEQVERNRNLISKALRKLVEQKGIERAGSGKRGDPFRYSLLLYSYIYEESNREMKVESNPLESGKNSSIDDFQKNEPPNRESDREIPSEKQAENDPTKGGLYEVMDDGQITY
ncbi:MAG: AAA family ATPase [Thermodesulfobacteriota bacterium]|jgi:predicted transcriptional regulator